MPSPWPPGGHDAPRAGTRGAQGTDGLRWTRDLIAPGQAPKGLNDNSASAGDSPVSARLFSSPPHPT
ncbi:hypothetical protein LX36DRAFT_658624 [Colletotrichum falcatum]|nr:hypothetical protein LX36DRAFT_658624 [Colletotrichum falcatum]